MRAARVAAVRELPPPPGQAVLMRLQAPAVASAHREQRDGGGGLDALHSFRVRWLARPDPITLILTLALALTLTLALP